MKLVKISITATLVAAIIITACLLTRTGTPPGQPMAPSLKQLDLDGDLVVFMNTDTIETNVLEYIDTLTQPLLATLEGPVQQMATEAVATIQNGLKWSGLLSLDSYAMSMAPAKDGLTRTITITTHSEADADKPLWRLIASEPSALEGIQYVPADAVYAANTTASLTEAWKIINDVLSTFCTEGQAATYNQQIAMAEMMLGTNITALTESLNNEILLSLQFSEDKTIELQPGMTIPEPNLLIGLKTTSPLLGKLILDKLTLAQVPITESAHDSCTLHTITTPVPLPVPFELTLMVADDYLLIGSTREAVVKALDSKANDSGLIATALYKKLLADAPEKTSSIEFVSPRFAQTYIDTMKKMIPASEGEEFAFMDMMFDRYKNMYAGGYSLKTPTGIYTKTLANYNGAKPCELVATAYTGMLAAIGIPSILKAYESAQEKTELRNIANVEKAKGMCTLPGSAFAGGMSATNGQQLTEQQLIRCMQGVNSLSDLDVGEATLNEGDLIIGTAASYE